MTDFNKIQSNQIEFFGNDANKRIGIFMTDMYNTNGSNTFDTIRNDAIGEVDPIISFSTTDVNVTIVLEWEGISSKWDGYLRINGSIIDYDDPNATFETFINTRRFKCTYEMNIEGDTEINFSIVDANDNLVTENSVQITEYIAVEVQTFEFLYGVLNNGETNTNNSYPKNQVYYNNGGIITPQTIEQTYLKTGDFVKVSGSFDKAITKYKIIDDNNAFLTEDTEYTQISAGNFSKYLEVIKTTNLSDVTLKLQAYDDEEERWGDIYVMNEDGNFDMQTVVNINNDYNNSTETVTLLNGYDALDNFDDAVIDYVLPNSNYYWNWDEIENENTNYTSYFSNLDTDINSQLTLELRDSVDLYNLNFEFDMPIINTANGISENTTSVIPIASQDFTANWNNSLALTSSVSGETHTIIVIFNQELNTDKTIDAQITVTPDSNISITNKRYDGENTIKFDVEILDSYSKGNITFTLNDVENKAHRALTFSSTYSVRGFEERTITASSSGDDTIFLGMDIIDENYFNAILVNNEQSMNYKPWDSGNVLTTDPMTKTTGLATSDQYAYTYNPATKEIILSQYIISYLLSDIAQVRISKN